MRDQESRRQACRVDPTVVLLPPASWLTLGSLLSLSESHFLQLS